MKGGLFSQSETFLKILSTAYAAIVILAMVFAINQYRLIYLENRASRETLIMGYTILSSNCITELSNDYPVKFLLSEKKIDDEITLNSARNSNPSCLNYNKKIYIEIYDEDNTLLKRFGDSTVCENPYPDPDSCKGNQRTTFSILPGALNITSKIIPVTLKIFLGA
jgi:hypothetical protein